MNYQTMNCPNCKGELQVPKGLTSCICMYCGEKIKLKEEPVDIPESALQAIEGNYLQALDKVPVLVEDYKNYLSEFSKQRYSDGFGRYIQIGTSILQPAERYASLSGDNFTKVVEQISTALIERIVSDIAEIKGSIISSTKAKVIDQYRFFLTVYTVPMILHLNYIMSEPLADSVIEKWRDHYPKFAFHKGSYESLQAGFEKKSLCFITTAVCEAMGKSENCYELTAFRSFRDSYMQQTEERQAMVKEYYKIAPVIVTAINMQPDCKERYQEIWERYLQPCLANIEDKHPELCERHYTCMVQELKRKFYLISD